MSVKLTTQLIAEIRRLRALIEKNATDPYLVEDANPGLVGRFLSEELEAEGRAISDERLSTGVD